MTTKQKPLVSLLTVWPVKIPICISMSSKTSCAADAQAVIPKRSTPVPEQAVATQTLRPLRSFGLAKSAWRNSSVAPTNISFPMSSNTPWLARHPRCLCRFAAESPLSRHAVSPEGNRDSMLSLRLGRTGGLATTSSRCNISHPEPKWLQIEFALHSFISLLSTTAPDLHQLFYLFALHHST